jgi:hypothetical protein
VAGHFRANASGIEAGEIFFHRLSQQSNVRNFAKVFRDEPNRFVCRHPTQTIEAREIYRSRIGSQGAFKSQIEINIEVTHGQLAQSAIDRLAIPTAREV